MTRQGYQRIEFVLDISADPRDAEISDILASLPNLARSEFIRQAIYAYAHVPAEPERPAITADELDRLWQTIEALQRNVEWLSTRPAAIAAPAQPAQAETVASSGLAMGGPRKPLKAGSRVETKEGAPVDAEQARLDLLKGINGYKKGE